MKDFKTWWGEQEIFAGEGAMEAAEQAWDAAQELTAKACADAIESEREKWPNIGGTDIISIDVAKGVCR